MLPSTGWYCWWNAKSVPIVPPSKATERFVNSNRIGRRLQPARYQLPPPPPPPPPPEPPPEPPPPPNPLELPPLGVNEIALETLVFIDWRLLPSSAAWNGWFPTYQALHWPASMPSNAFAQRVTQPNTIAYGRSAAKMSAFAAHSCRYFSPAVM